MKKPPIIKYIMGGQDKEKKEKEVFYMDHVNHPCHYNLREIRMYKSCKKTQRNRKRLKVFVFVMLLNIYLVM